MKAAADAMERGFGRRVRELRKGFRWSQDDLAARMSAAGFPMHQSTVAKMESAGRPTSIGEVTALASLFQLPLTDLLSPIGSEGVDFTEVNKIEALWHEAQRQLEVVERELAARQQFVADLDRARLAELARLADQHPDLARTLVKGLSRAVADNPGKPVHLAERVWEEEDDDDFDPET
jgi:transcriptional regulator with XRE-family HTH domain